MQVVFPHIISLADYLSAFDPKHNLPFLDINEFNNVIGLK